MDRSTGFEAGTARDDVPAAWRARLARAATAVGEAMPGGGPVAGAVLDYVLDGGPDDVLASMSAAASAGTFHVVVYSLHLEQLTGQLRGVPGPVAYRCLRWVDAVSGGMGEWSKLALPPDAEWVFQLVRMMPPPTQPTLAELEAMQVAAGWEPATLLLALATTPQQGWVDQSLQRLVLDAPDLADTLLRHRDRLAAALPPPIRAEGAGLAALLAGAPTAAPAFAEQVAAMLLSSSKRTRSGALDLLTLPAVAAEPGLREALLVGARARSSQERLAALSALHVVATSCADAVLLAQVMQLARGDDAATVRRLAEEWDPTAADGDPQADEGDPTSALITGVDAEPAPVIDWRIVETPELRAAIARLRPDLGSDAIANEFLAALLAADVVPARRRRRWGRADVHELIAADFAELGAPVLVKAGAILARGEDLESSATALLAECGPLTSLDHAAALLAPFAFTPRQLLQLYCRRWGGLSSLVAPAAAAGFARRHADDVLAMLRAAPDFMIDRTRLFDVLAAAPALPAPVVQELFGVALGTGTSERALAQRALAAVPGKQRRILAALDDGRGEVRAAAARWLGDLGDREVVPALETAFAKEKQDVAKAAMLDALEALGCRAEDYLDLAGWEREAAKAAGKTVPAALDWLDWSSLPPLTWGDGTQRTGQPVPSDVVRHLVVQAVKAKTSEPNALLRRYCALWDATGRQVLADALLRAWLAHDVAPIPREHAQRLAESQAAALHQGMQRYPAAYSQHERLGWTKEQLAAAFLPDFARIPAGSAIASKGLLAVVAACGTGTLAPPTERYLKQWFGRRLAQSKALLGMLAWVDHPAAAALLLSVGNRFRTKALQDEATRLARELAARKGWTVDELADRTIPTAGLEPDGTLVLDYGPRQFTASLRADLTLALRDPDGKELKALPAPRTSDDAELAVAAKQAFSAAKKELATTVKQQTERLEEALCTGRAWAFADWQQYLLGHPIVRHLVGRLVWQQLGPDGDVVAVFRPLDDGTLTDADDEPVDVPPDALIALAHDAHLDPATVAAWVTHLADYQVSPPFPQLGAGFWELPDALADAAGLNEFEGWVLEAFALRGRATKLGWTRGQAEDGGVFVEYRKRYPTLGLEAVLGFTGNSLPEEPRLVALRGLTFERVADDAPSWNAAAVPLRDVPAVLLSRCRSEVAAIAAEGTGFDPEWERKTGW